MWSSRSYVRTGQRTAGKGASCVRVTLLVSLAAAALGGCSSVAPLPNSGLVSAFVPSQPPRPVVPVDLENDGREAQRPPVARMFQREDDPTQPFSPNYGEIPLPQQPDDGAEDPVPAPA